MSTPNRTPEPPQTAGMELARRAVSEAKMLDTGYDLSMLTDTQFEDGLKRVQIVQARIDKLIGTVLTEGVHYGNPEDSNGRKAFKRPILYKSGAQEIRRVMRVTLRPISREITETADYVSCVVEVQAIDSMGRVVAQASAACNSKEKRFRKFGNKDSWTYIDPREALHDCISMAEKRAGVSVTLEASGATRVFAVEGAIEEIAEAEYEERAEWSTEQKRDFMLLAKQRGMLPGEAMKAWVQDRCEGRSIPFVDEVPDLMDAIGRWSPPKPVEVVVVNDRESFEHPPKSLLAEDDQFPAL